MSITVEQLHGGWQLQEYSSTRMGEREHPFGDHPQGILIYSPGGWMSATLMPGDDANSPHRSPICYAGRFYLEDQPTGCIAFHEIQVGILPFGRGTVQRREASLSDDGDTLTLRAQVAEDAQATLVWKRQTPEQ